MAFEYVTRDSQDHVKRTKQDGGQFDRYLLDDYTEFKPSGGNSYAGRIAPPTWVKSNGEPADHYGYDLWVNYKIGTDEGTYVSRKKHGPEGDNEDPVQNLMEQLRADGDKYKKAIKEIKEKKRVLVWWLPRGAEHEGWKLWAMPWTFDKDLAKHAYEKGTGSVLLIDHPLEGYDVSFDVSGSKRQTKYEAIQVARRPTPLVEDAAQREQLLQFVSDNPLHTTFEIKSFDYIKQLLDAVDVDDLGKEREEDTDVDKGAPAAGAATSDDGGAIPETKTQGVAASPPEREQIDDPAVGLDDALDTAMDDDDVPF
jgi:hypothetical protein